MFQQPSRPRSARGAVGFPPGITSGLPVPAFFLGSGSRSTALDELHARGNTILAWQRSLSRSAPQNTGSNSTNDNIRGAAQPRHEEAVTACSAERIAEARVASRSTEQPTFASFHHPHRAQQDAQPTFASFHQPHQAQQGAESAQHQLRHPQQPEPRHPEEFRQLVAQIPPMRPGILANEQAPLPHPGIRVIDTEFGVVFHL
eukprot:TRINITY_DN27870_c1_g2_i1.p1 TRINITY_DN27870_c1_g2~~TRINITY_DN27870_c1_g2_i1.p1  ORF type:complete len:202 (+),score=22.97 TRINITY_DN27870_c1_g2_i1:46-651(+)